MRRYAFIDVQNTETTAIKVLSFTVDHGRLFSYLKERWQCEKVFFYPGIRHNDASRIKEFEELTKQGAVVRPKFFFVHKNQEREVVISCTNCKTINIQTLEMGHSWKCNCDVELTSDVLDHADNDTEVLLFSGDGDFEFLIRKIVGEGSLVTVVSSAKMTPTGPRYSTSRLSTKIRRLTQENGSPVRFMEMDNLKFQIKKNF